MIPHPYVHLDLDACVGDSAEIRRVVLVELGDLLADGPDLRGDRTHASATCDGPLAVLRVDDPISRRSLSRSIDLAGAYPRTLALALVELISASWTELEPAQSPPSLVPPHDTGAPLATSAPPSWHVRVAIDGSATRFADVHVLSGLGGRISDASASRIGWMIDAHVLNGSQGVGMDSIRARVIDVAAAAQLHRTWSSLRVDVGAGVRGGSARLTGVTHQYDVASSSLWGGWFGPFVSGAGSFALSGRLTLDASIETGYVMSPVTALVDGRQGVAVSGSWIAGHLGIGVQL